MSYKPVLIPLQKEAYTKITNYQNNNPEASQSEAAKETGVKVTNYFNAMRKIRSLEARGETFNEGPADSTPADANVLSWGNTADLTCKFGQNFVITGAPQRIAEFVKYLTA